MIDNHIELIAREIYKANWRKPSPIWENTSDNVRDWVRNQAQAAILKYEEIIKENSAAGDAVKLISVAPDA